MRKQFFWRSRLVLILRAGSEYGYRGGKPRAWDLVSDILRAEFKYGGFYLPEADGRIVKIQLRGTPSLSAHYRIRECIAWSDSHHPLTATNDADLLSSAQSNLCLRKGPLISSVRKPFPCHPLCLSAELGNRRILSSQTGLFSAAGHDHYGKRYTRTSFKGLTISEFERRFASGHNQNCLQSRACKTLSSALTMNDSAHVGPPTRHSLAAFSSSVQEVVYQRVDVRCHDIRVGFEISGTVKCS